MSIIGVSKILVATAFIQFAFAANAFACSYADGSLFPTRYDHIKAAPVILLAEPFRKNRNEVDFHVREVLKGEFTAKDFTTSEVNTSCTVIRFPVYRETEPSPLEVTKFPKNVPKYLLFLERSKDKWRLSIEATEAMNSPIWDEDTSEYLTSVRHLIRVSEKNNYDAEKRKLNELLRLAKGGRQPQKYPDLLVKWIEHHLRTPTPSKSFNDLREMFRTSSPDVKRNVLWAFAWGGHKEAAKFIEDLLGSPVPLNYIGPFSQYITTTRNEVLMVRLGRNYPEMGRSARWGLMWALIKTADERHSELMMAALRSADNEEAGRLAEWFVRYPQLEATEIVRKLVGGKYQENWELTFGLAGMGDQGTISWASKFMNSDDEDRWMAFYTIAHSPLEEADSLAKSVIGGNDQKGLVALIQGYEESHNPRKYERLRDVISLAAKDKEVEVWLKRTLEGMSEADDPRAVDLLRLLGN